jgi:hypothetical protein
VSPRRRLPIDVERLDERTVAVAIADDPLGETAAELFDCVRRLLDNGVTRIVVEAAGTILNSKLVDALVRAAGHPSAAGGGIAIVAPPYYVHQMVEVSESGGPLLLVDTRADALDALA